MVEAMHGALLSGARQRVMLALLATLCPAESQAADPIEEILVVGARLPRPVQDVIGTVDVISRDALLDSLALDTAGAVRYLPGVSAAQADTRFGVTEFTIRGLSGNRVATLIDGIPVADQFDIGSFSNSGQDFLVPDSVSRIEILRGPASTLFGSDALGGVLAIVTRDPEEYLRTDSASVHGSATFSGADRSRVLTSSVAGRGGRMTGVLHGTVREGDETDVSATSDEDPLERRRIAAQIKLRYALENGNSLRLNGQYFDETVESESRALLGYGRQFRNTTSLMGDDERRRDALGLEYDFAATSRWIDAGRLNVFVQRTRVDQQTRERRDLAIPPVAIERTFDYAFDDVGAVLDFERAIANGATEHRVAWGLSLRRSEVDERRNGLQRNLTTGASTNVLLGEVMPVRDFPDSRIVETAAYVHDELRIGRLLLIPGFRIESYQLDARADALFRRTSPNAPAEDVDETALVPKLGLQWRADERTTLFAQYARGFRAPPFEDVNIGLDIPLFNYRAIPNPDLESETSDGVELGLRHEAARFSAEFALYGADYDDFIESKANVGVDPESGAVLFQSCNIGRARIYGVELKLAAPLSPTFDLSASANWTRGEDRDSDEPLNTIDPPSLVTQLAWRPRANWSAGLAITSVARQSRVNQAAVELFEPDGYVIYDVTARYQPREGVRLQLGLFNLSNETYWRWASVRGRPEGDPLIDLLSAPGRHGAVSMHVDF